MNDLAAHALPRPRRRPDQPRTAETLENRWLTRWSANCILACQTFPDPVAERAILKHRFEYRMDKLLRADIAWRSILRGDLDSPLATSAEFDRALTLAIERRGSRMNRQKGKRRSYAQQP